MNDSAIRRIEFPANVTSLKDGVLKNTSQLKKVFFRGPCPAMDEGDTLTESNHKQYTLYAMSEYKNDYESFAYTQNHAPNATVVEWDGEPVADLEEYDMSGIKFPDKTFTYNGTARSINITGTLPTGVRVIYAGNGVKKVGNHRVIASFQGDDKHEPIPSMEAYITILKADNSWLNPAAAPKFTGNGIKWNIASAFGNVSMSYSTSAKGTFTKTMPVKPGVYYVKAVVKGTDNYNGISKVAKVTVLPKGTTLRKPVAVKKGFKVKWKKQAKYTTGYQIQYSLSSKFKKGNKTVTVKGKKKISRKITKLKARKKYYVRIRTYYKAGGKTYTSAWSAAKSVKTK